MNITITHKPEATLGKYKIDIDGTTVHSSNAVHPSELLQLLGIKHDFVLVAE